MTTDVINGVPRELKPCPFCNGQVSFHQDDECSGCHLIHCAKCDAFFDFATGADPENEAAELRELRALCACAWNHRTLLATAQPADHSEHDLNMVSQPAADGELEWTEDDAAACGCNYRDAPCERCWALGWELGAPDNARAAQSQKAVAVTDVATLKLALAELHKCGVKPGSLPHMVLTNLIDAAHKTGEEE